VTRKYVRRKRKKKKKYINTRGKGFRSGRRGRMPT
jgi:hypothetical protein